MSDRLTFLGALVPQVEGPAAFRVAMNRPPTSGEAKGRWREVECATVEQVAIVLDREGDRAEAYVALAAFAPGRGRKKDAVVAKSCICADVDDKLMPGATREERHENARKLVATIPAPGALVDSGGGFHPHLRLPEGERVEDFEDPANGIARVELLGIALRLYLEDGARELFKVEVKLDHTHGAERVWRVPPGWNLKSDDGAKTLTADRQKWRPVRLVGIVEGLATLAPADLSFLAPYMNAAAQERAGSEQRDDEPPPKADAAFRVEMLPPRLRQAWPMHTGDQSKHDFVVAAALAKAGQPPGVARDAIRTRRARLEKPEDREKGERAKYVDDTVRNAYARVDAEKKPKRAARPPIKWRPFPVGSLPDLPRRLVEAAAAALGCDPTYIALPLLSALAASIGNRRRIVLKLGWTEPAIVWAGIVGDSGTLKSPALEVVMRPLWAAEYRAIEEHKAALEDYEKELEEYRDAKALVRKGKLSADEVGDPPERPVAARFVVSDITVEALAARLEENPLGLFLVRDELAGWFRSFDKYRDGKGGDTQSWLELHRGGTLIVDRKGAPGKGPPTVCVENACVSIAGGIQPPVLSKVLTAEHLHDGLAARLVFAMPPKKAKHWTEATIPEELRAELESLFDDLRRLPLAAGKDGKSVGIDLPLSPEAKAVWIDFYERHAKRQARAPSSSLAAAFSKLEGYAARFALLFHVVRTSHLENPATAPVDAESMRCGIAVAEWCAYEAVRVYEALQESEEEAAQRDLLDLVRVNGGTLSTRDLMRSRRRYRDDAAGARGALDALVKAGLGAWGEPEKGREGRPPSPRFVMHPEDSVPAKGSSVTGEEVAEGGSVTGGGGAAEAEGPDPTAGTGGEGAGDGSSVTVTGEETETLEFGEEEPP